MLSSIGIRAEIYNELGEHDKAIKDGNTSLELDSTIFDTYVTLAFVFFQKEQLAEALEYCRNVIIRDAVTNQYFNFGW